jgi:putative tRNA adenosine deaminase-associated protein
MWFGVVRVDGEDDPRVFVSDAAAVARSSYGDVLLTMLTEDLDEFAGLDVGVGFAEDFDMSDDGGRSELASGPLGDADLLADLGVPAPVLYELCAGDGVLPTDAVSEIADRAGFTEALESMR